VPGRTDPRVSRTTEALTSAIVELAGRRPISRVTVAELAARAGVTRATFYNRYASPLDLLVQVLYADLELGHTREGELRAEGGHTAAQLLRTSVVEVADHVERFRPVYRHALGDPADHGVYAALVRHFTGYALEFMQRSTHPDAPRVNQAIVASFVAHGFAGAIEAWLADDDATREDLVDAAVACAPAWWS
jgi:AcrR family transcriptional regulator